jgi:hypothetical protein
MRGDYIHLCRSIRNKVEPDGYHVAWSFCSQDRSTVWTVHSQGCRWTRQVRQVRAQNNIAKEMERMFHF